MLTISRRASLLGMTSLLASCASGPAPANARLYVCPPCGCASDGKVFDAPGACSDCGMTLVPQSAHYGLEPHAVAAGVGDFVVAGGAGREDRRIGVHFYLPTRFARTSPVLLIIPGSGRDADEYRDAWIDAAERHSVLVAALRYPEADYDFAAYQMGGIIRNLQVHGDDVSFDLNNRPSEWIFSDFDRIFGVLARAAGSTQTRYDLFGHSAGGQILHRLALFHPHSKGHRIVAANAGLYTLPAFDTPMPYGLKNSTLSAASLRASFALKLTLLLGGLDNRVGSGGEEIHTPLADQQGLDRLSRGRHFFASAQSQAHALGTPLNWRLQVVPDVGHDQRAMAQAAARLLYG